MPGELVAGVLVEHRAALTAKGSRLYAPCGRTAFCFSTKTLRQIGALPLHAGEVTAVCTGSVHSDGIEPLATGSSLGEVQLWDSKALECLGGVNFKEPVLALRWTARGLLTVLLGHWGRAARVERVRVDELTSPKRLGALSLSAKAAGAFDAAEDTVALGDGKELLVWVDGWQAPLRFPHKHAITAALVDPQRRFVAGGEEHGVVLTWWGFADGSSQILPARWHWHTQAVTSLALWGPVVLSGGNEGVLCARNINDDTVTFVPRLVGPIRHIGVSPTGGMICMSLGGNSLGILAELQALKAPRYIHGVDMPLQGFAGYDPRQARTGVLHRLGHGGIALTGSGSRVQFLDTEKQLQTSQTLRLGRGDCIHSLEGDLAFKWTLWHVAFSPSGLFLLTCEGRRSPARESFHKECLQSSVVKWWRRQDDGMYSLHSVSHNAHAGIITVALAHPSRDSRFVTASLDGIFKFWDLPQTNNGGSSHCWQCSIVGTWHSWPILSGCLSADGSALALGLRGFVALWGAEEGLELQQLALDDVSYEAEQVHSTVACGRFLLLASVRGPKGRELVCWDLADLNVVARAPLELGPSRSGEVMLRAAPPVHPGGELHLAVCKPPGCELQLWRLAPAPGETAALALEATAAVELGQGLLDVLFPGAGLRLLCWTSRCELWDVDLADGGKAAGLMAQLPRPVAEGDEAGPKSGGLARLLGRPAELAGGGRGPPRLTVPRLRATTSQQAGIVPRLVERFAPAHVPSHMLYPPASLWASLLSVYGKPLLATTAPGPASQGPQGAREEAGGSVDADQVSGPGRSDGPKPVATLNQEGALPPWASAGRSLATGPCSELVDVAWMDKLVQDAFREKAG